MLGVKVLAIADIHDGSNVAITERPHNPLQRFYKRKWDEMCKNVGDVDYLLLLGDLTEGVNQKEAGKFCWTTDVEKQIDDGTNLANMIKYDKLAVVYSSGYHTGENPNADAIFAKQMNAWRSNYELTLQLTKHPSSRIHMSHYIGVSASMWRTTPLARELAAIFFNEAVTRNPNIILRGHAHYHCMVAFTNIAMIVPCWKARDLYMIRKGLFMIPKHGYILLEFNDDGQLEKVHRSLFDMPKFRIEWGIK